jgi:hypothetical protein
VASEGRCKSTSASKGIVSRAGSCDRSYPELVSVMQHPLNSNCGFYILQNVLSHNTIFIIWSAKVPSQDTGPHLMCVRACMCMCVRTNYMCMHVCVRMYVHCVSATGAVKTSLNRSQIWNWPLCAKTVKLTASELLGREKYELGLRVLKANYSGTYWNARRRGEHL